MIYRILILSLILPLFACPRKPISFISEYIDFTLDSTHFTANGIYIFENGTDRFQNVGIAFPFAVQTAMIDTIRVYNMGLMKETAFKKNDRDIYFKFPLAPVDTAYINIFYKQKTATENVYVLQTTKEWGEPLKRASYNLLVKDNLRVGSFSMKPDSAGIQNGDSVYFWKRDDFIPEVDFQVTIITFSK